MKLFYIWGTRQSECRPVPDISLPEQEDFIALRE